MDSVIVTALKRSSLVQQTPISMTVVSGERLSRLGLVDLEGLAAAAGAETDLHRFRTATGASRRCTHGRGDDRPLL
ncbi:hypothetical protein ACRAWD_18405 [Caulobacter segnis]